MTANFLGLRLDALTLVESANLCEELSKKRGAQHVVLNAGKVVTASRDPLLRKSINNASLVNADGQSVVWAARFLGMNIPERVAGIDLFLELCRRAAASQKGVYLLGARQEVVEKVSQTLESQGVKVLGFRNGYWQANQSQKVVDEIALLAPDFLFIAMPSPAKEIFVDLNLEKLNTGLTFGVGGSFDVLAGVTKRAPMLMQKLGFEWLYRLAQEPRRMFKRYLFGNSEFIWMVLREKILGNVRKNF